MTSGCPNEIPAAQGRGAMLRDALIVAIALVAVSLAAALSLPRGADFAAPSRAIVFSPWTSEQDALAMTLAAGHRVLRSGISRFIVITAPSVDPGIKQVKPQGALLMLALSGLAGCLDAPAPAEASS
ncbi:hypothetical protein FG93_00502 [Bosea sp. LC85]|uniref:hypothetical protein n=1 Tax=Bosea sp. LC85 TaxID=1502851 RepID=UPI0004E3A3E0|nr:hypothetical protein [Bosea sp. LC85]KFC75482.1 hypothetical protein FG93_00502 [Bosea sp. LC85]